MLDPFAEARRQRRTELERLDELIGANGGADRLIADLEDYYRRDPERAAEFEELMVADLIRTLGL